MSKSREESVSRIKRMTEEKRRLEKEMSRMKDALQENPDSNSEIAQLKSRLLRMRRASQNRVKDLAQLKFNTAAELAAQIAKRTERETERERLRNLQLQHDQIEFSIADLKSAREHGLKEHAKLHKAVLALNEEMAKRDVKKIRRRPPSLEDVHEDQSATFDNSAFADMTDLTSRVKTSSSKKSKRKLRTRSVMVGSGNSGGRKG